MTTTTATLVQAKQIEAVDTDQYTSTNCRTIIDNAKVTNVTSGYVTLTAYAVANGGSAGASTTFISAKSIAPGETYHCPELVGQVLENGDKITMKASAATSLNLRMSGRKVT